MDARHSLLIFASVIAISAALALGCGSSNSTNSTPAANAYATAYKSVSWGSTVTATFPSSCTMTLTTTGQPDYTPNPYYLAPAGAGDTIVATTPVTHTSLAVIAYSMISPGLKGTTATLNICPTKASTTTSTSLGAVGYLISGTAMFNPYEMDASTPAVADNASYTFKDSNGVSQTAYFLDQCNSHSNGSTWHAHGNPNCVTSSVDTSTGPSHIIGIALDGFPIYGGRDINGSVVDPSTLDACNGITSATPEFPSGAYHYVLPLNVTTKNASINCYSGTVSQATMAYARKLACDMKMMLAMLREKQQPAKPENMRSMPGMSAEPQRDSSTM